MLPLVPPLALFCVLPLVLLFALLFALFLARHQVQAHEKALRDREARALSGSLYFPFRTEEEVKAQRSFSNAQLKANLDAQLRDRDAARASLSSVGIGALARSRSLPATPDSTSLHMELPSPPPPPGPAAERPQVALQAAIDDAYSRYSSFLRARAGAHERARAFSEEQASLAEQAELLKREEGHRRSAEVSAFLRQQIEQKELKYAHAAAARAALVVGAAATLPPTASIGRGSSSPATYRGSSSGPATHRQR
jgi:hypothetical protein